MILVDAMWMIYRANYKLPDLRTRSGRPTGLEYGFLKGLEALRRYFKDELILCWEGRKNFRKEIDPNYKANRNKKRDSEAHQRLTFERLEEFKKFLYRITENAYHEELEADDVMASLAKKYSQKEKVLIYSRDKDMFQILQKKPFPIEQCRQFQFRDKLWTVDRIEKEIHGLKPNQLPMYYAFIGDKVDNIKGVSKVRSPLIAAAIREGYTPENISDHILFSTKEVFALEEFVESGQFETNLKLITLRIKEIEVTKRNWDDTAIGEWLVNMEFRTLKLCQQCGIENVIEEHEEF